MPLFDTHILSSILLIAFVGGLIGLDRTAAGQFMISQPIVAGPITGLILGDFTAGLMIGAILELIWVMDLPIGTFVPADATVLTVSATTISVVGSPAEATSGVIGFSMLLTVGMAPITMLFENSMRKWNSKLADTAIAAPPDRVGRRLALAHLSGLVVFFVKSFFLYLFLIPAGVVAVYLFGYTPAWVHDAMTLFLVFLPLIGVASIVRKLSIRTADRFLLAGFVTAAILSMAFHVPALIITAITITIGWIGVRYGEQ